MGDGVIMNGSRVMVHGKCRYTPFLKPPFSTFNVRCSQIISQARLPEGATLLGITLSSDKTALTSMTGDHSAHPLLITLANIDSTVRVSTSSHALKLLALIPVPKFVGVKKGLCGILENRLLHTCLDFIPSPLKLAARAG